MKPTRFLPALAAAFALALPAAPALANTAADYFRARVGSPNVPELLSNADSAYYRSLFAAIDAEHWAQVENLLAQRGDGPLHAVALAEYYLHSGSPQVPGERISHWMSAGAYLPQAQQLAALGAKRGLDASYFSLPGAQPMVRQPYASKRIRPRSINDGTMPDSISSAILDHIKNDDPSGARVLLDGIDASLSPAARAEWRQKVAWSYYIENNDPAALAMAQTVADGTGPWVAEGDWVGGLAAWRMGDCQTAGDSFRRTAAGATNQELMAAAHYWASRALVRCRAPEGAAEQLRAAATLDETLYGMLAAEQLGQRLPRAERTADFTMADWQQLRGIDNVRAAVALSQIGEDRLADEVLQHQAQIGDPSQYNALSRLARELGFPSTQLWMAHNAPRGASAEPSLRYPAPRWTPIDGWKVDPALAYAHTLQESNFRPAVVSPAGARGLMQIMPAAARDHAGAIGVRGDARDLSRPGVNLAFGQRHLQMLQNSPATQGLLPKIMAAYNAGLTPVTRWNYQVQDQGDPLLYMESIPYWETRGYVGIVMRNYWMYERQAGAGSGSRRRWCRDYGPPSPP